MKSFGKFLLDNCQCSLDSFYYERDFTSILDGNILSRKANGTVTFPHSTMEIFLAALYFILMLDAGQSVEDLLGSNSTQPVLFMNHLFLYFCLSMVNTDSILPLSNRQAIYHSLCEYSLSYIDHVQLDLTDISVLYPTLNFNAAVKNNNELVSKFLHDILSSCRETNGLLLSTNSPVSIVLNAMNSSLSRLKSIVIVNDSELLENNVPSKIFESNSVDLLNSSEHLSIIVQSVPVQNVIPIQDFLNQIKCGRKINIVFVHGYQSKRMVDMSSLAHPLVKSLHICNHVTNKG